MIPLWVWELAETKFGSSLLSQSLDFLNCIVSMLLPPYLCTKTTFNPLIWYVLLSDSLRTWCVSPVLDLLHHSQRTADQWIKGYLRFKVTSYFYFWGYLSLSFQFQFVFPFTFSTWYVVFTCYFMLLQHLTYLTLWLSPEVKNEQNLMHFYL